MENENIRIEINGEEIEDLYSDLIKLEVELDEELAGMFRITIGLPQQEDGGWRHLDDERLIVWSPVTIKADFDSGEEELMSGYITHVRADFSADPTQSVLEICGLDGSVLMDREDKLKAWANKKDSEIAAEILTGYGFTAQVTDTEVMHEEAVSTIIQRETDMQFLRRLALRNGFDCYVEGSQAYFQAAQLDAEPQPVLAAHFGNETNLMRFAAQINALSPANVAMVQVDRLSKEIVDATVESGSETVLGGSGAADLLALGMSPGQVHIGMNIATGPAEMAALCRSLFHRGQWFLTVEGVVDAARYGHVLLPRRTVPIKGVGETYSGMYYVSQVTHRFSAGAYAQEFRARRNALRPNGDEPFSGSAGLFG